MDLSWMAWTVPTAVFFAAIALLLATMTVWDLASPSVERVGLLGFPTNRGDRLFVALLASAFIHLGWLAVVGPPLWWALGVSVLVGLATLRWG